MLMLSPVPGAGGLEAGDEAECPHTPHPLRSSCPSAQRLAGKGFLQLEVLCSAAARAQGEAGRHAAPLAAPPAWSSVDRLAGSCAGPSGSQGGDAGELASKPVG